MNDFIYDNNTYECHCHSVFTCWTTFADFRDPVNGNGITNHDYECVTRNEIKSYVLERFGQDIGSVIMSYL